jgi:hypothetical protein
VVDAGEDLPVGRSPRVWRTVNEPGTGPPRWSGLSHANPSSKTFPERAVTLV